MNLKRTYARLLRLSKRLSVQIRSGNVGDVRSRARSATWFAYFPFRSKRTDRLHSGRCRRVDRKIQNGRLHAEPALAGPAHDEPSVAPARETRSLSLR